MKISMLDIAWVAGIVEGEGCINTRPKIIVSMTDRDVVERLARLWSVQVKILGQKTKGGKTVYRATVGGNGAAASWLMTLYPLLGERRRAKAREALIAWRTRPFQYQKATHCTHGHEFSESNTSFSHNGGITKRVCKTCVRDRRLADPEKFRAIARAATRRYRARKKALCSIA